MHDDDEPSSQSKREPLRLDQFLKLTGIAATGGHAKVMIQEGIVLVNGKVELRRRRKLAKGDVISLDGEEFSPDEFLESE
ncbi:MAG: RNA-binding S4 domain-containing protein [Planctomycetaceae bacterium]|nr:RNA-binding S4 domain-containing protein [Planctomycetaceae bacterium]